LYFTGAVGLVYGIVALLLSVVFLAFNIRLFFEPHGTHKWAKRTFAASLVYLPILFTVMVLNMK
jgi:heme o synthase